MTFNAGSIDAFLTLNRDEFKAGMRASIAEAEAFEKRRFRANVGVDTNQTKKDLAEVDQAVDKTANNIKRAGQESDKSFKPLLTAVALLAPALGPLGGFAAAAGVGLTGMGAAGIIAIKGITNEIKMGTKAGTEYQQLIGSMKTATTVLQQTTAQGILPGFNEAVTKLKQDMPIVNVQLQQSAHNLGDITQHLVGGLLGGFVTFSPLMHTVEGDVDRLASRFEIWASGPGGAKFAQTLSKDYALVKPVIGDLVHLVTQLVSASNGIGSVTLTGIGTMAKVIGSFPVPVLTAIVDGLIAMRVASDVSIGINLLAKATKGLAVAETEAAVAGAAAGGGKVSGLLGSLAANIKGPTLVFAGLVAGARLATEGMSKLNAGSNGLKSSLYELGHLDLKDFAKGLIGQDPLAKAFKQWQKDAKATKDTLAEINKEAATPMPQMANRSALTSFDASKAKAFAEQVNQVRQDYAQLNREMGGEQISQAGSQWSTLQGNIQKSVDATDGFLKLGGGTVAVLDGVAVGQKTLSAAMQQTNGDRAAALGLIKGEIEGMGANRDTINSLIVRQQLLTQYQGDMESKYHLTSAQVDLYTEALGGNATAITNNKDAMLQWEDRFSQFVGDIRAGNTSMSGFVTAIDAFNKAGDSLQSRASLMGAAMVALNGDALGYQNTMVGAAKANEQLVTDMNAQTRATIDLKTGAIDYHNAAAAPLLADLQALQTAAQGAATATYQHEVSLVGSSKAASDASDVYYNDTRNALISEASQLGLTHVQAKKLADTYFSWPKDAKTQIAQLGGGDVSKTLQGILEDLDKMTGMHHFTITADTSQAVAAIAALNASLPANLRANGAGTTTSVAYIGPASGVVFNALGGINGGGKVEDHSPLIYPSSPGTVRVFAEPETGGEAYIPLRNDARRPRAQALTSEVARRLGGAAYFESGGFTGVTAPKASASKIGGGSSSKSAIAGVSKTSLLSEVATLNSELQRIPGLANASASSVQSSMNTIITNLLKAKNVGEVSGSFVKQFEAENAHLQYEIKVRDQLAKQLATAQADLAAVNAKAQQEQSTVANGILGGFNIASSGNGYQYGILSSLNQQVADAAKFADLLKQAQGLGLNQTLLQQLAEAGPAQGGANLQAIVQGGAGYVSQLNSSYDQLNQYAQAAGAQEAANLYAQQQAADTAAIKTLQSEQLTEQQAINANLAKMTKQIGALSTTLTNIAKQKK